jgi:D-sedoheptulose 7-phosphate isomerase
MEDFDAFVTSYYRRFTDALERFDRAPLRDVLAVLDDVVERRATLWVAGNGGSASIVTHGACDLTKGTSVTDRGLRCLSLSCNEAVMTAIANDIGYDEVYRAQLGYYLRPGDALLLVSSRGNAPSVLAACKYANDLGVPTIAFVGFDGGQLRRLARHCVWIPEHNYGIVEDAHQSLIHVLSQYMVSRHRGEELAPAGARCGAG